MNPLFATATATATVTTFLLILLMTSVPAAVLAQQQRQQHQGKATFYMLKPNDPVACETHVVEADIPTLAAVDQSVFDVDRPCGRCIRVQGPNGGGSIVVRIVDRCEGCGPNGVDLSFQGFPRIAHHDLGRVDVTWEWVDCATAGAGTTTAAKPPALPKSPLTLPDPASATTAGTGTTATTAAPPHHRNVTAAAAAAANLIKTSENGFIRGPGALSLPSAADASEISVRLAKGLAGSLDNATTNQATGVTAAKSLLVAVGGGGVSLFLAAAL